LDLEDSLELYLGIFQNIMADNLPASHLHRRNFPHLQGSQADVNCISMCFKATVTPTCYIANVAILYNSPSPVKVKSLFLEGGADFGRCRDRSP